MRRRRKAGALPLDPAKGREALGTHDFRFGECDGRAAGEKPARIGPRRISTRCPAVALPKSKVMGVQGPLGSWRVQGRALAFLILLSSTPALAISDPAEMLPNHAQEVRAERIGEQLRCLVCQNESIEDSGAGLARDLRHLVRERVAAGDTDQQVIDWMVARYGNFVRLKPPFEPATWLLWLSPVLALGIGTAWILLGRRKVRVAAPLSAEEQALLARLMERE